MSSTANLYRVGDYVFFEINTASPYQIRRIEELNKTPSGNVEAKVMCFYRRRDIGSALLKVIDSRSAPTSQSTTGQDGNNANGGSASAKQTEESSTAPATTQPATDTPASPEKDSSKDTKNETVEMKEDAEETKPSPVSTESETAPKKPESETGSVAEPVVTPATPESEQKPEASEKPMEVDTAPTVEPAATTNGEKTNASSPAGPTVQPGLTAAGVAMPGEENLSEVEKHQLLHRELFLSRQIETLPATHIRGKCTVTLLNELETPDSYLNKEDSFFYSLVYDPAQKTILADKGEIRVGEKYQAEVPETPLTEEEKEKDRKEPMDHESLVFHPYHNLTDRQMDQFMMVSRAIGTLARAFDLNSVTKYAGLHTTVAAASRDVTTFQGMILLHQADYDVAKAVSYLVPPSQKQSYPMDADKLSGHTTAVLGGPVMVRDQMEEWSAAESNLFEEALEKYGKDFNDIRQDFLPWKSLKDIVEYYYMWKTTDRYIQQKRVKAAEAESRLKQVYIPTYAKPNPNAINSNNAAGQKKRCEGCSVENSEQWYSWGPSSAQLRLCKECWLYWKKYGGLKQKHKYETFDKLMTNQPQDTVQGMIMPRPGDRLVEMSDFGGRVQRCSLPGCSMQFANLQTLNQHLRRDHGLPWVGQDTAGMGGHTRLPPFTQNPSVLATGTPPLQYTGTHTLPMRNGPRTRIPVFLRTTLFTKSARRLAPKHLHNPRHAARNPFDQINTQAIRTYCQALPPQKIQKMARILVKMGLASASAQASVSQNVQKTQQQPARNTPQLAGRSSAPAHGKQSHPNVAAVAPMQRQQHVPQKRPGGAGSGSGGQPPMKRVRTEHEAAAECGGNALFVKWVSMPDDYYFHRTKKTKLTRRILTTSTLRKMGRQPHRMHASVAKLLAKHGMLTESH